MTEHAGGPGPMVVSIEMGYGHLRPAWALAELLGTEVLHADRAPLADAAEQRVWARARRWYEITSRLSQGSALALPFRTILDRVTSIEPLHPRRDLSRPSGAVRILDRFVRRGIGAGLVRRLEETGAPLLTTFYAPAVAADRLGRPGVHCVVTDSDINRVWAPLRPRESRIRYLAPNRRVVRRLLAYGVAQERIELTGFPLPHELLGGSGLPALRRNLAARLVRLDPSGVFRETHRDLVEPRLGPLPPGESGRPPLLVFAVGGSGVQTGLPRRFLPDLRPLVEEGRVEIALVAGTRREVSERLHAAVSRAGLGGRLGAGVEVLFESELGAYFREFNRLLARTDVLWTKPSEITFFAALGIPLVLSAPVGVHERYNRRWAREAGAAVEARRPERAGHWLPELLEDGTLAGVAWSGYTRLPSDGLYRIAHLFHPADRPAPDPPA